MSRAASPPRQAKPFQFAGNRILAALPDADLRRLKPHLSELPLEFKRALYTAERPIRQVFFPDSAVCSIVSVMRSGGSAEVATVGNEGLTGLVLFFGENCEPGNAFVQVAGRGRSLPAKIFREELERRSALHHLVGYYAHARVVQIMQNAACNQLHPVKRRTCKWLLNTHDRVFGDEFRLTQEFLSLMVGVRRATVNAVARELQEDGLIHYRHGKVTIIDRDGLKAETCECYQVLREYYNRFLHRLRV